MEHDEKQDVDTLDCAVCLQKCHHPTQLPCGHIFCFLCVKGIAIQNKKCAMCRTSIPADFLDKPVLLENLSDICNTEENAPDIYQWYYEGRNGWWKYDERSNSELEAAYNSSATDCVLLLAGALYRIDFQTMMQTRRSDHTRRRRVRRDMPTLPAKGIAGIKITDNEESQQTKNSVEDVNPEQSLERESNATTDSEVILAEESNDDEEYINIFRRMETQERNGGTTEQHTTNDTQDT